jgi:uncharacterized membrane protein YhaH (DUF805 family)
MMMKSYTTTMRNYATFSGRMSRAAYWQFVLVYVVIAIVAFVLDNVLGTANDKGGLLTGLVAVVHLIPNLASLARRLHDSDKSALWMLLLLTGIGGLLMLIFALLSGTPGPNRFGVQPTAAPVGNAEPTPGSAASVDATNRGATQQAARVDVVAELERLAALRSNGSLSDTEYEVMKSRLLARSA